MLRIGVIGCGEIARAAHLPALARLQAEDRARITAFDTDLARVQAASDEFGVAVGTDWRTEPLDAVVVLVPPGPNAELATEALSRGLHVFCEKPPGRNLEQARRMARAAAATDRITMVGFNRRFNPLVRRAMDRSVAVAPPTSFCARFSRPALGGAPSNTASDWLTSDGCHLIDLAVAVMGFPRAVGVGRRSVGGGPDNVWALQLHGEHGSALVDLNFATGSRVEVADWAGPGYDVHTELPATARWAQRGDPPEELRVGSGDAVPWYEVSGFLDAHRAFIAAIEGSAPAPGCDFAHGAELMQLIATLLETPSGTSRPFHALGAEPPTPPPATAGPATRTRDRPVVLLHHPTADQPRFFPPDLVAALQARTEVRTWATDGTGTLDDVAVLVTGRGAPPLAPQALEGAGALQLLVVLGASVRHLGPDALLARGVTVANTADAVAELVAEHCLMVTLAGLRHLTAADATMHRGGWRDDGRVSSRRKPARSGRALLDPVVRRVPLGVKQRVHRMLKGRGRAGQDPSSSRARPQPPSVSGASALQGQVVGLLGWGHVARHFTRLLAPFGCTVLVWTESAPPEELAALGARPASIEEILGAAKVVSLHRGLTESSRGFLDAARLAALRPGSVLVNTARGPLVDEAALLDRLRAGDVTAALDVFDDEPLPPKHPLRSLPNVILTPHNASTTIDEERRLGTRALQTVLEWLDGADVAEIDAARLARMT